MIQRHLASGTPSPAADRPGLQGQVRPPSVPAKPLQDLDRIVAELQARPDLEGWDLHVGYVGDIGTFGDGTHWHLSARPKGITRPWEERECLTLPHNRDRKTGEPFRFEVSEAMVEAWLDARLEAIEDQRRTGFVW